MQPAHGREQQRDGARLDGDLLRVRVRLGFGLGLGFGLELGLGLAASMATCLGLGIWLGLGLGLGLRLGLAASMATCLPASAPSSTPAASRPRAMQPFRWTYGSCALTCSAATTSGMAPASTTCWR